MATNKEQKKRQRWICDFERAVLKSLPEHAGRIDWDTAKYLYDSGREATYAAKRYIETYK